MPAYPEGWRVLAVYPLPVVVGYQTMLFGFNYCRHIGLLITD
jgi:hypothetical protein